MRSEKKLLLLTVGYGEGHNSAAKAIAQAAENAGWSTHYVDPCLESSPRLFKVTQQFYHFCVRSAPWVWGITYAQTDTADWASKPYAPILRRVTQYIEDIINEIKPDAVLCTYPLYGYMIDALRRDGKTSVPYGMVVTDALEISRPWMLSGADIIYLPDEYSLSLVHDRYAIPKPRLMVSGFPVKAMFNGRSSLCTEPSSDNVRIVYGAFAPLRRVRADVTGLLRICPGAYITVLAGEREEQLRDLSCERVQVLERTDDMASLFENSHLYIGKAGAATVFEAYSMKLPVVINYSLPGQEQGNLALLQLDGAGVSVHTSAELLIAVRDLLAHRAAGWKKLKNALIVADRSGAAELIIRDVERRFIYESCLEKGATYR